MCAESEVGVLRSLFNFYDCRHTVKYIAQTDLDEMFILTEKNKTLVEFMDNLMAKNPEMASASFISRRAKSPVSFL